MKFYKHPTEKIVFCYELDGSQDSAIDPTFIRMTDDEVASYLDSVKPKPPSTNDMIKSQIIEIEKAITTRRLAEAATTYEGRVWMTAIQNQIAELRAKLV